MTVNNYTIGDAAAALTDDHSISVAALTVAGKKAVSDTAREIAQAVREFSDRDALTYNEFALGLAADVDSMRDVGASLAALITQMHNTSGSQTDLQDQFFELEGEAIRLGRRILEKRARVDDILSQLLDPLGHMSRLQTTFPSLRKPYLYRFGR